MKVVINNQFGGFSLSHKAVLRYAEIKGIPVYPEKDDRFSSFVLYEYWTVPTEERPDPLPEPWRNNPIEERQKYNREVESKTLNERDIPRDDPALVQVVEELGRDADGEHATLMVVEIPDDVEWTVEEYDGNEWIAEKHRTWP